MFRLESGSVRVRRIAVIDTDAVYVAGLEETLANVLWTVVACADPDAALGALETGDVDAIWTELANDADAESSVSLLRTARATRPDAPLLVVTTEPRRAVEVGARWPAGTLVFAKRDTLLAVRHLGEEHDRRLSSTYKQS